MRRERCRRLVEDEDRCSPDKRAENRDALLLADGEIADARLRVELEAIPLDHRRRLRRERSRSRDAASTIPSDEEVLRDTETLHELIVLVDHADAMAHRLFR